MAWYSLLPSHSSGIESWVIKICIFLAVINISPWLALIVSDFFLYLFRTISYEIPVYGGRAKGEEPPLAPRINDRTRRVSLAGMIASGGGVVRPDFGKTGGAGRGHQKTFSQASIEEEKGGEHEKKT